MTTSGRLRSARFPIDTIFGSPLSYTPALMIGWIRPDPLFRIVAVPLRPSGSDLPKTAPWCYLRYFWLYRSSTSRPYSSGRRSRKKPKAARWRCTTSRSIVAVITPSSSRPSSARMSPRSSAMKLVP